MMKTNSDTTPKLYVGLDVHKEQTSVALAEPGPHLIEARVPALFSPRQRP